MEPSAEILGQMVALMPRLKRFARVLAATQHDADDLVQAAFERGLTRLDQWAPGTRLDSWMFRIMQTVWIDHCRRERYRSTEPLDHDNAPDPQDADRAIVARMTLEKTQQIIGEMPEEQRTVLRLICVEGLSYKDAATTLDLPIGTVMSRLSRARLALAQRTGITEPSGGGGRQPGRDRHA